MKNVLSILTAALLAGVASAGSVTWGLAAEKDGSPLVGGVAYLFAGDSTAGVADSIQDGSFSTASALASSVTDQYGEISVRNIGSYASQTVKLYTVLFDTNPYSEESNFVVSEVVTQSFGASGNKTFNFTSSLASATWNPVTPQPIPEPTTVALLALGLAALGLKRKVA